MCRLRSHGTSWPSALARRCRVRPPGRARDENGGAAAAAKHAGERRAVVHGRTERRRRRSRLLRPQPSNGERERRERGGHGAAVPPPRSLHDGTTDDGDVLVFTFAAPALARSPGPLIAAADADDDGEQERKKSEGRNRKETEKNFARSPIGRPGREHCQQRATATAENILRNLSPDEKRRRNSDKREISFNSTTRLTPPSLNATAETTEITSSPSSTTRGSKLLQRSAEPKKDEATSLSGGGTG